MPPKRQLFKGRLRRSEPPLQSPSYTQKPASKDEVSVRTGKKPEIPGKCTCAYVCILSHYNTVIEFSFQTPKPFLDPSIIGQRIQMEKQWAAQQEKKAHSEAGPSQRT